MDKIYLHVNSLTCFFVLASLMILFGSPYSMRGQNSPINPAVAARYFDEANDLCSRDGGKLWSVSLCTPMLFVDRQTRAVVANQADKEGFLTKSENVFVGQLPIKVNIANTATEWAGVKWTMLIFPLTEDKQRRANLMAHEMWHRIQSDLGFPLSDPANDHLDSLEGRVWMQLEWRALTRALRMRDRARRRAIRDALLFRSFRRSLFPNAAAEERALEMNEGLAEYTGVKLSGAVNLNQYVIEKDLQEIAQKPTFVRSFAYASGPAYGVLLDEAAAGWRKNLKKVDDLGDLLHRKNSIKLPRKTLQQTAESRAKDYDGDRLQAFETTRENNRRRLLAEYHARLVEGAVLEIPLQKMNLQYNPNNLVPLDSLGTVYPDIRVVDIWGILTVTTGGALRNPSYTKIYVSAPKRMSANRIEGDGWILELNDGWVIEAGERKGDYAVKKLA